MIQFHFISICLFIVPLIRIFFGTTVVRLPSSANVLQMSQVVPVQQGYPSVHGSYAIGRTLFATINPYGMLTFPLGLYREELPGH